MTCKQHGIFSTMKGENVSLIFKKTFEKYIHTGCKPAILIINESEKKKKGKG